MYTFSEVDEAREDDDSEDSEGEDQNGRAAPRTVWAWGGSFAVFQSRSKPVVCVMICWRP